MKVPVLIMAFNRPDFVQKAMAPVCQYQPDRIYLACDGPRANKDDEAKVVKATQNTLLDTIDWNCSIKTLFRDKNLGCAYGPYTAISWFLEHEEYGIIIEDDVIVGQDFFKLCEDLLPRYANEERIMEISAENHSGRADLNNTYVYTHCMLNWGWATWRRAWAKMDMTMSAVHRISLKSLVKRLGLFRGYMMYHYFLSGFKNIDIFEAWDTRWYLSILDNNGLIICPGVNLAVNIGTDSGTHYEKADKNPYADLKIGKIQWPLVHNDSLELDKLQKKYDNDDFLRIRIMGGGKKIKRIWRKICKYT